MVEVIQRYKVWIVLLFFLILALLGGWFLVLNETDEVPLRGVYVLNYIMQNN